MKIGSTHVAARRSTMFDAVNVAQFKKKYEAEIAAVAERPQEEVSSSSRSKSSISMSKQNNTPKS